MPERILLDTAFVIALINHRDEHHQQALEWSFRLEQVPAIITAAVLLEIGTALARGFKREAIAIIEKFTASAQVQVVPLTPELLERSFALYKKHQDKSWSLVDCVSFVVMKDEGTTQALTLDRHFEQAGFVALMRSPARAQD